MPACIDYDSQRETKIERERLLMGRAYKSNLFAYAWCTYKVLLSLFQAWSLVVKLELMGSCGLVLHGAFEEGDLLWRPSTKMSWLYFLSKRLKQRDDPL